MKKSLYAIILFIAMVLQVYAQEEIPQLPNAGFESWENENTPQSWATNIDGEIYIVIFGIKVPYPIHIPFGKRTTDAHSGFYALQLSPQQFSQPFLGIDYVIPAICQLGKIGEFSIPVETILEIIAALDSLDFGNFDPSLLEDLAGLQVLFSDGLPYPMLPSTVNAWVKFSPDPESDDMATIIVYATKWNIETQTRDYVGMGYSYVDVPLEEYTEIIIPIDTLIENTVVDSISVMILVGGESPSVNTIFYIDDITLSVKVDTTGGGNDGIVDYSNSFYKVFSYENQIYIFPKESDLFYDLQIFDIQGRIILERERLIGDQQISTINFSKGVCFVNINTKKTLTFSTKILIR